MTETNSGIDTTKLESYLLEELGIDVAEAEVLDDGLNLMIAVSTEEGGKSYVLRRPSELRYTDLFNSLEQEYRLMQRLQDTAVNTQAPVLFCYDDSVIGGPFLITTYLEGATVPAGSDLPERFRNVQSRGRVADLLIDTLAEIHSLDVGPFEDACEHRTPQEQVARATDRLDEATSVTGRELPTLRSVADWLQRNAPSDAATTLIHGDFGSGNVLFTGTGRPEITGVLDWETAFLGDPLAELGYFLLYWRDDNDPILSLDELETRYSNEDAIRQVKEVNENGLCPFTTKPGSPGRRELVTRYEDKTGISFENERFYRAHSAFMLATIWEDLHRHRVEAGAESDQEPLVDYMSMIANGIVNGEF